MQYACMAKPIGLSDPQCVLKLEAVQIPCKIVPKARPRVTENGTYNPKRYTASKGRVLLAVIDALHRARLGIWPTNKSYGIDLRVAVHKPTDGDVDGLVGNVMDACEGRLWMNDRQVVRIYVDKVIIPAKEPPFAVMNVCVYEGTGFEYKAPKKSSPRAVKLPKGVKMVGKVLIRDEAHRAASAMTVKEYRDAIEKKNERVRKSKLVHRGSTADDVPRLQPRMTAAEYRAYVEAYRKKYGKVPRGAPSHVRIVG